MRYRLPTALTSSGQITPRVALVRLLLDTIACAGWNSG
jgi:hypothetical protein